MMHEQEGFIVGYEVTDARYLANRCARAVLEGVTLQLEEGPENLDCSPTILGFRTWLRRYTDAELMGWNLHTWRGHALNFLEGKGIPRVDPVVDDDEHRRPRASESE